MNIQKRDGRIMPFDKTRIENAVLKAFEAVDTVDDYAKEKAKNVADYIENKAMESGKTFTVEEIQDLVESGLMSIKRKDVAKAYILYREKRSLARGNTTDKDLLELLNGDSDYWNYENSNKNSHLVTTQRDYMAGILSTDLTRRILLPKDIVEAHDAGIIHFHDADYFGQNAIHNCFDVNTKFITSEGVKSFSDFQENDEVMVLTHTGEWKKAIVKKYGKQDLYRITFKRGVGHSKDFLATRNHRWLLENGNITTELKVGDTLIKTPIVATIDFPNASKEQKQLWCKGFAYGDGQYCKDWGGTKIRLCGRKNKYKTYFVDAGYSYTNPNNFKNGDAEVHIPNFNKNEVPEMNYKDVKYFIHGLLSADGDRPTGKGSTKSNEFKGIQITGESKNKRISDLLNIAGYYISGYSDVTNVKTNYGERSDLTRRYRVQANQSHGNWKVKKIQFEKTDDVWCLEVEDNHSFILEGGIVTGNCELINLNDMLQNGTVINGVMIEKPHRFLTACTIATQIILGVSSSSYGGASISLTHLAPFVRESYNRYLDKYLKENLGGSEEENRKIAEKLANKDLKKEIEAGVQTFNYQVNSMTNTNGQAPFLSVFMYLGETEEYKEELAMIIEEFLRQRILGFKNEKGVYVTPAFPKLLYVLEKDNISEDSKYWYLTKLAAECTSKRMVPDYISEKVMLENKINKWGQGDCYPCMGGLLELQLM